jgi:ribosomal protein S18 acetylase RimI-like enzyme
MQIRLGTSADLKRVLPLMKKHRALHAEWDGAQYAIRPDADRLFQLWLGPATEDPRAILVLAEEDKRIIGYLAGMVESDLPIFVHDEYAIIKGMWVEPDARRRGVGKALVKRACEEYAAMGVPQVRIRTATDNEAGRKMLESCGFRVSTIDLLIELLPPPPPTEDAEE